MKIFEVNKCRKASLNLSINAIVVLILAITMLGLGLGFIRTMFKGATSKLGSAVEGVSLKNPADASNPLTMDEKIDIKQGGENQIEVGIYNKLSDEQTNVAIAIESCRDTGNIEMPSVPNLAAPPIRSLPTGESAGYKAILSLKGNRDYLVGNTYICSIEASSSETTPLESFQFFMEVK